MAPLQVLTLALLATAAATLKLMGGDIGTEDPPNIGIEGGDIGTEDPPNIGIESDRNFPENNPEKIDGNKLYEGDMLLTKEQLLDIAERKFMKTSNLKYYWQDGPDGFPQVPYRFNGTLPDRNWEKNTCLKFVMVTDQTQPHLIFIKGGGCWSYVGRIYSWKGQYISIGGGCEGLGVVDHEIGHAMGFQHEHSRSDRDKYVYINTNNVKGGGNSNLNTRNTVNLVAYDYGSTMHYSMTSFSKNGLATITALDPLKNQFMHYPTGLTFRDIYTANLMYNCTGKWKAACGSNIPECKNDGYVGATCLCVCPPGTSGTTCETVTGDYYGDSDGCSETVTKEGTVSSPGYPARSWKSLQCTKVFTAPDNQVPQLKFTEFKLHWKSKCSGQPCCSWETLEIRNDYPNTSTPYCSDDIKPGTVFKGTSKTMIMFHYARANTPGWKAELTFVPASSSNTTAH